MNTKVKSLLSAIWAELYWVRPGEKPKRKLNPYKLKVGALSAIRNHCSRNVLFPSGDLMDREEDAAAEISFHILQGNLAPIEEEVEYIVQYTYNNNHQSIA